MLRKRNKEGGFTLIELMIVISVIGILAVVLIPRLGGVKDSARYAGVITNVKSVEVYIVGNIDRWLRTQDSVGTAKTAIYNQFKKSTVEEVNPNALENPLNNSNDAIAVSIDHPSATYTSGNIYEGTVHVDIITTTSEVNKKILQIRIFGYGRKINSDFEVIYQSTIDSDGSIRVH